MMVDLLAPLERQIEEIRMFLTRDPELPTLNL